MKWWPEECAPGDMIRVRCGAVWHYGIFVSEEEVIAFGEPPAGPRHGVDQRVIASDVDAFARGGIVERARLDREEEKKRLPPEKTVALARSRLGEGGYDLLHNNCEHFANACVFGTPRSSQEEALREKWRSRPVLDVYLMAIPAELAVEPVFPPERNAELLSIRNASHRRESYAVWKLLERGLARSFGLRMEELRFEKKKSGKWVCDGAEFSLSHAGGAAAAVAVSNAPVGIDLEEEGAFLGRFSDPGRRSRLARRVCTPAERETVAGPAELLTLWTKKECLFKCYDGGSFLPHKTDTAAHPTVTRRITLEGAYSLSVCGEHLARARYYLAGPEGIFPAGAEVLGADAL